ALHAELQELVSDGLVDQRAGRAGADFSLVQGNIAKPSRALSKNSSFLSMTSGKNRDGDLPPSSRVTGIIRSAATLLMMRPTSVEPVNAILAMRLEPDRAAPASVPRPLTMFRTPSGSRSAIFSTKYSREAGVCSAGF